MLITPAVSVVVKGFNTASGKYYCNSRPYKASIHGGLKIGFGKPHTVNGQNALPFDPQGLWI